MNMSELPYAARAERSGFTADPRFVAAAQLPSPPLSEAGDPLARAWEDGFAAGFAEASSEAGKLAEADQAARGKIELSLARLNAELAELLRLKLFATVEVLCEATIAPLALDQTALATRVERAAAMLARVDDERLLRLHPDDIALVEQRLPDGLPIMADPALERGALRVESSNGGIEDGPAHWRRAIAEAIAQC
jgi:flagellar assembly protein FliH